MPITPRSLHHAEAHRTDPAQIRALAFAAALGSISAPLGSQHPDVLDLAGEEAFLGFLARISEPYAA